MSESEGKTNQSRAQSPSPGAVPTAEFPPQAVAVRRSSVSLVWLIPLVALVIGGWLAFKTYSEQGPKVQIQFKTAAGLEAGKTKVKFKDVDVGQVTAIDVNPDLKTVTVTAQLKFGADDYLTSNTRFWVERPRVTASRVSGLETLLSGAYIAMDPVTEGEYASKFVGLDEPPLFTTSEDGKRFELQSPTLGSLNVGSPVYYRQIQVGQVVGYQLDADGGAVSIEVFISAPHDDLVLADTRFWNASGVDFSLSASGLKVDTQSLLSVLIGGVSFDTPDTIHREGTLPDADGIFPLYASKDEAHEKTYQRKQRYLLFFQGSVRGLAIDAPVLLRGIRVGRVLDIQLTFSTDDFEFHIPVLIELEPDRVGVRGDVSKVQDLDVMEQLVGRGLRGQLQSGSLLTGQLYIDLDFHPDARPEMVASFGGYKVLPTVPAPLEVLTTEATSALGRVNSILGKVDAMPIAKIGQDAGEALASANAVISSSEIKGAIAEVESALAEVRRTAEILNTDIAPELATTLRETTKTVKYTGDIVSENSPMYIEMRHMFRELSAAARSIRVMAEYLERHPEALLKGKGGGR